MACVITAALTIFVTLSAVMICCPARPVVYERFVKNSREYLVCNTFYSDIYYKPQDKIYVEAIAGCVDFYMPLLIDDFDIVNVPKIPIIISESADEISTATGASKNPIPMGVYFGGIINILSPSQWIDDDSESRIKERFLREGPVIHELTHVLTDIKSNENYSVWFTEGVSLYYEYKYTAAEWREDLKNSSALITLSELENKFSKLDEAEAYRRSFDIISDYADKFGEQTLQERISELGAGLRLNEFIFE